LIDKFESILSAIFETVLTTQTHSSQSSYHPSSQSLPIMSTKNLDLARAKLANPPVGVPPFPFEDLPTDWNASLWTDIRNTYGLSLPELGALQKARCGQPHAGKY
jgi:hypothetical protein